MKCVKSPAPADRPAVHFSRSSSWAKCLLEECVCWRKRLLWSPDKKRWRIWSSAKVFFGFHLLRYWIRGRKYAEDGGSDTERTLVSNGEFEVYRIGKLCSSQSEHAFRCGFKVASQWLFAECLGNLMTEVERVLSSYFYHRHLWKLWWSI